MFAVPSRFIASIYNMKNILIFLACLIALTRPLSCSLNGNGDFKFFNEDTVSVDVCPSCMLKGEAHFEFGDHASFLYEKYFQLEVEQKCISWMTIGVGYRQIYSRDRQISWTPCYCPVAKVVIYGDLKG